MEREFWKLQWESPIEEKHPDARRSTKHHVAISRMIKEVAVTKTLPKQGYGLEFWVDAGELRE